MERYFNVAGPCFPGEHYMLPALDRLPEIRRLVARGTYFVDHAPRQTGKTTALRALARENEGWMAVFDTESDKPWDEKLYNREVPFAGKTIHVVGL